MNLQLSIINENVYKKTNNEKDNTSINGDIME